VDVERMFGYVGDMEIPGHVLSGLMRSAAMTGQEPGRTIPVETRVVVALVAELEEHRRLAAIHQRDPAPSREQPPG
jgi:hypothetical protein